MSEADPDVLLVTDRLKAGVRDGDITEVHRGDPYAEEGDRFDLDGATFEVVDVTERTLGDLTDADARRMGASDLEAYKTRLEQVHPNFDWDPDAGVVRHRFERVDDE